MKKILPEIKKILSAKDLVAKIVCVLLAIILWAYISNTNIGETQVKIPVTFTELPDTLIRSKISSRYITVTLAGRKDILKNINIKSIKSRVDLSQPKIGKYDYPVEINKDELPENIDVKLSRKVISVTIERKFFKKVKVKTDIADKVKEGYMLGRIRVIPDTVVLSGAESIVANIDFIKTVNISIANLTGRIIKEVPIDRSELSGINTDISKVKVIIPIIESANLFKFEKEIIIKNTNENYKYILSHELVNVYLQSENTEVKPFNEDIQAFIDIGKVNIEELFNATNKDYIEKNFTVEVAVRKTGIKVISLVPDVITVKIMGNR